MAIVVQTGFSHYDLSGDPKIAIEGRKAHRFVAMNCEDMARKIFRFAGVPEVEIDDVLAMHAQQLNRFKQSSGEGEKTNEQPVQDAPVTPVQA